MKQESGARIQESGALPRATRVKNIGSNLRSTELDYCREVSSQEPSGSQAIAAGFSCILQLLTPEF